MVLSVSGPIDLTDGAFGQSEEIAKIRDPSCEKIVTGIDSVCLPQVIKHTSQSLRMIRPLNARCI